jgi:hypothetical protein
MLSGIQKITQLVFKQFFCCCFLLIFYVQVSCQREIIGIIDFYGHGKISEKYLRKAITIKEGDSVTHLKRDIQIKNLKTIPGVKQAQISFVCCEESKRQSIVYIGISGKENNTFSYREPPVSVVTLPKEIIYTYDQFEFFFNEAIEKGESGEDRSQGHSLMSYAPVRAVQEKFIDYADRYLKELKDVLKNSSYADQRAVAASVIAYSKDKNLVADDLLNAVYDNDEIVRNNATRALSVIAGYAEKNAGLKIKKIPADPFIKMINSIVWTDRNKAVAVLLPLTESRDSLVLKQLKDQALPSIIEMSQWKTSGHAIMSALLLARIAGFPDEEVYKTFETSKKDNLINEMIRKINGN